MDQVVWSLRLISIITRWWYNASCIKKTEEGAISLVTANMLQVLGTRDRMRVTVHLSMRVVRVRPCEYACILQCVWREWCHVLLRAFFYVCVARVKKHAVMMWCTHPLVSVVQIYACVDAWCIIQCVRVFVQIICTISTSHAPVHHQREYYYLILLRCDYFRY